MGLRMKSTACTSKASIAPASSAVTKTMAGGSAKRETARARSKPESPGMWMSRKTASIVSCVRTRRASAPFAARWIVPMRSSWAEQEGELVESRLLVVRDEHGHRVGHA